MIHDLQFHMPEIKVRVSQRTADFDARLLFANREEYSISGFPRSIIKKKIQTGKFLGGELSSGCAMTNKAAHTRDSISSSTTIRHRPQWTPPGLRASCSPSFDSGIQLSSRPKSVSSSLKPTMATGSQSLLTAQELPAPDSRPTNSIQELPAEDTRDPRAIQQAMVVERERDRIRKEERALLEDRLKTLEATQKELTSVLAGLQSPSSLSGSGNGENRFDFEADGPLINLSESSGTVKVEGWKVEFEVDGEGKFEGNGRQYAANPLMALSKADRVLGKDPDGFAEGSGSGSRRRYKE
jgi:hypothetical protein